MKNLFVVFLVLAVALSGVRCTTDERPAPEESQPTEDKVGRDAAHQIPGIGVRFELHKPRTDCKRGFGLCVWWDDNPPGPNSIPVVVSVNGTTSVLRILFVETYLNSTNDTFEIADPEVFQSLASDLGYTQIDVIPGDYAAVHHPGTLNVDYIDIPIQTLS